MIPLPSGTKIWLVAGITDSKRQRSTVLTLIYW